MPKNKLYDGIKITKLAPAMNYGMRKDKPVTASKTEGSYSGSRTPYARISKKKGGSITGPALRPTKQERTEYGYMNDPDAPKYTIKDGYMVLKEKSQNIPTPKARPKMQRKKAGGKIY